MYWIDPVGLANVAPGARSGGFGGGSYVPGAGSGAGGLAGGGAFRVGGSSNVNTGVAVRPKPINPPSAKKVRVDMEHVKSGHMVGGSRVSPKKDLFPQNMTPAQVEKSIMDAYKN